MRKRRLIARPMVPRAPGRRARRIALGVLLLTVICTVALAVSGLVRGDAQTPPSAARLVPDCAGAIRDWLLGLPNENAVFFEDTQAQLVRRADEGIRFHVYYALDDRRRGFEAALRRRGWRDDGRIVWHRTPGAVWPWMRDLFLAAADPEGAPVVLLHHPDHYLSRRFLRSADETRALVESIEGCRCVQTDARIDGGAVVVDEERVLASRAFLERAGSTRDASRTESVVTRMRAAWGLPVEVVALQDVHESRHCDLVMMPAGGRRMVLASPALGAQLLASVGGAERTAFLEAFQAVADKAPSTHGLKAKRDTDLLEAMQARAAEPKAQRSYDALRRKLEALGYTCILVPQLALTHARDGIGTTFSYVNAILDERAGARTVYLPTYRLPTMDAYASQVWQRLGYRVVAIDCLAPALHGGAMHCMSQVFRAPGAWSGTPAPGGTARDGAGAR